MEAARTFSPARFIGVAGALLSAGVALFALRYALPATPAPDFVAANGFSAAWLPLHATSAAIALLVGPGQFSARLRARRPALHRLMGRIYVAACLIGGLSGLVLALGASTGPVTTAGFALLAVGWVYSTAMAWRLAMRRQFDAHRTWMVRSFAFTFAAVTLRLYLPFAFVLPFDFAATYSAISFLCWVPNQLVAQWWLDRQPWHNR